MKKIVLVLVAAMVLVFTGCEKKETISMPFDVADVNNISPPTHLPVILHISPVWIHRGLSPLPSWLPYG